MWRRGCWRCWPNARYLDYETEYAHISVVYSTKNQEIYQAEITVKADSWYPREIKPYRWLNPEFKDNYLNECEERGVDPMQAWDDTKWCDLETEEDWLEKAEAISIGTGFDERIQVPLTLSKDEMHKLMVMAHERDVTLNKMVEIILEEMIQRHQNEDLGR